MKITFTLDSFDFDGTHKVHQVAEHIGREISKIIPELLRKVGNYQDDHSLHGGTLEITVKVTGPDLNEADTADYNHDFDFHFKVLEGDRVVLIPADVKGFNPDKLTKTERSYLQEIMDHIPNKKIAINHHKSEGTVHTHRRNIYSKTNCKSCEELKVYVLKHKLLDL